MNNAVEAMLGKYRLETRNDYDRAIKEIIQEIALVGLWRARFFEHAAFYGGSSLRILYGLDRFSEDLDFTLLKPDMNFSLEHYNESVVEELSSYGFTVEVDTKTKEWQTNIRSAFIKANTLGEMLKIGVPSYLTKGLHPESRLKIKVEVDTHPTPAYEYETRYLEQPVNIGIRSVIERDIFAGKMHALLFREWKGRVKGRDWYDWLWFVRRGVPLQLDRLEIHLKEHGNLSKDRHLTSGMFQEMMKEKIHALDLQSAIQDVVAFVHDRLVIENWTKEMLLSRLDRMCSSNL
jgi:predicted nucleotidyltransferase component of viral defense system